MKYFFTVQCRLHFTAQYFLAQFESQELLQFNGDAIRAKNLSGKKIKAMAYRRTWQMERLRRRRHVTDKERLLSSHPRRRLFSLAHFAFSTKIERWVTCTVRIQHWQSQTTAPNGRECPAV